jgi:transposase InsO family protein
VALHGETKGRYGTPRVERALRRQGISTSRKRVGRLRWELGLTRERWLYLAIVLDTCCRRIVGWSVSERRAP